MLKNSLTKLRDKYDNLPSIITMDVVIPSFRVNEFYLDKMVSVEKDQRVDHRFVIVIDRNIEEISPEQIEHLQNLEKTTPTRVRVNEKNMGASFSRNRGMKESHSD